MHAEEGRFWSTNKSEPLDKRKRFCLVVFLHLKKFHLRMGCALLFICACLLSYLLTLLTFWGGKRHMYSRHRGSSNSSRSCSSSSNAAIARRQEICKRKGTCTTL